jgi:transcriptional regulator with XRE-family HTH domain
MAVKQSQAQVHHDPMGANLRFLCSMFPSIALVCRKTGLNRQQFNKYLSGQVRPSRHNLRIICDFFRVTEAELHLESSRFSEIISLKKRNTGGSTLPEALRHIESLYRNSAPLDRYVGYYFRYHYSFNYPGMLIKSFAQISERHGRFYWTNIESTKWSGSRKPAANSTYKGAIFLLADRIFIIEYHSLLRNSITEMILYPSHHARVTRLIGIQTGAPSIRGRRPSASRVMLEYLGRNVDVRKALKSIGAFSEDKSGIDPSIRELVRNQIPEGSYVLEVSEI